MVIKCRNIHTEILRLLNNLFFTFHISLYTLLLLLLVDGSPGLHVIAESLHGDKALAPAAHHRTLGPGTKHSLTLVHQSLNTGSVIHVATVQVLHWSPHLPPADGTHGVHLHLQKLNLES